MESDRVQSDRSKRMTIYFAIFLLLYETSTYIANDMIMPGMIDVVHAFSAPESMVSTSLTAFILGGASLQVFLGPISDKFGRRPIMLIGAAFFFLCNILIAISNSIETFIIARFFQGMGLCFIGVIGYATLQEILNEVSAVRLMAMMNNITILAPLTGPLLGSLIIFYFTWQMIFWMIATTSAIALIGLWIYMPETVGVMKYDGTIVNSTSLDLTTVKNNYKSLLNNQQFMFGSLGIGLATIPIIAWIGTSPLILIKSAHLNVINYGLWQVPVFLSAILGNVVMRSQTFYKSLVDIITMGSTIMILGLMSATCLTILLQGSYVGIIVGISIYSLGLGMTTAPLNRLTLYSTSVPKGTASALISVTIMLLTAIGNQLSGWIYRDNNNLHFSLFCTVCALFYLITYCLCFKSKRKPLPE